MSNNVKYKNTHPVWTALGIIFLVLILCAGVTGLVGWLGFGWFTNDTEDEVIEDDFDNGTRDDGDYQGSIYLLSSKIEEDDYEEYGVDPLAESAYTLKATLTGDNIYDIRVDWKIYWDESYTGNYDVTDYVTLNDYSNVAQEVVLSCLQPFGYNIYVEAYRTAYPDVNAVCKLDYVAKASTVVSASVSQDGKGIDLVHTDTVGVGTIFGTFGDLYATYSSQEDSIYSALISLQGFNISTSFWQLVDGDNESSAVSLSSSDFAKVICTNSNALFIGFDDLWSSSTFDYEEFIFEFASRCSSWYLQATGSTYYITVDGNHIGETDLVAYLASLTYSFAINGSISYTTSVSSSSVSFSTYCNFGGSDYGSIMDDATLTLDQDNIIFGI